MLTSEFMDAFVKGFCEAAPAWYDRGKDCGTRDPWCRPWCWACPEDWYQPEKSAYAMGMAWAETCRDKMNAMHEEELNDEE